MKATPDELKHYAQIYTKCVCDEKCPYYGCGNCVETMMIDALAYIEQLESRAEPKNRVLTLEELKAHKGFAWAECSPDIGSSSPVYVENGILFVDGDEINLNDNDFTYGECERCWLRKPTKEEMGGTPWEN